MNNADKQYFDLLRHILKKGVEKSDRTGTGTLSIFDYTMRFDMQEGFPLLTSKKMAWKTMVIELLWFLRGDTNIKWLVDNGCMIWVGDAYKSFQKKREKMINIKFSDDRDKINLKIKKWYEDIDSKDKYVSLIKEDANFARENANLGPVYGKQWRNWEVPVVCDIEGWYEEPVDQISNLINDLKTNPDSRRLMVNAWNVADLGSMVLPPCHYGFQCYTRELSIEERVKLYFKIHPDWAMVSTHEFFDGHNIPKRALSLKWNQRSVDTFLGLPFNISSYALLLTILAKEVNMIPEDLIFSGGDIHIYLNHIEQCKHQLKQKTYRLPNITIADKSIFDLEYSDITLNEYESAPTIKGELSN
jgi:thymidylate synthase